MKNRYIPFGYQIQNGDSVINTEQAATVQHIFYAYTEGQSFKEIAEYLTTSGTAYHFSDNSWNKNIVARILANEIYCGAKGYPAIISKEVYSQAASIQMLHFNTIITENPNWTLYKVYSDVASGTRKTGRSGYCEILRDAKQHRFDYIFVKSLSRFGRDTLEALSTIRRLKSMNIGLLSEVEKIDTLKIDDASLSILFAVAQEESATKSENIKFGIHQRMREGKALLNHTRFLGYTKDAEGQLVIVPEEAEIVRKIFSLYLEGNGVRKIKRYLEEHGIRTVTGKAEWSTSTIDRMLSNEKYMGILLLQKTYTPDFLTGKQKKNRGELSMYMIEDAHEAIIEKEVFEAVQKKKRWSTSCK